MLERRWKNSLVANVQKHFNYYTHKINTSDSVRHLYFTSLYNLVLPYRFWHCAIKTTAQFIC